MTIDKKSLAKGKFKEVEIEAVVIRADGTREELGAVSYWHRNPLRRAQHRINKQLGELKCAFKELWRRLNRRL